MSPSDLVAMKTYFILVTVSGFDKKSTPKRAGRVVFSPGSSNLPPLARWHQGHYPRPTEVAILTGISLASLEARELIPLFRVAKPRFGGKHFVIKGLTLSVGNALMLGGAIKDVELGHKFTLRFEPSHQQLESSCGDGWPCEA